ncbi:MAG: hypothetical protein AB7N76_23435 [Planctomycetota bacterium]
MDLVTALGRLLSDPAQRAAFLADRAAWAAAAGVEESGREALLELERAGLEVQAQLLIDKRRGEAVARLPRTAARLGEELAPLFQRYAPTRWPRGHLRHLEDALGFLAWLRRAAPWAPHSLDEAAVEAALARREGRALATGLAHHPDLWLSSLWVARATRRGALRVLLPLPLPAAWGRRLSWGR